MQEELWPRGGAVEREVVVEASKYRFEMEWGIGHVSPSV